MLNELFLRGGPVLYVLFFVTLIIFYILIDKYRFIFFNSESWLKLKLSEFKKEFPPETTDYKFVESVLIASINRESKTNIKMLVMINFIVDILYYFIDPRIRVKGEAVSG